MNAPTQAHFSDLSGAREAEDQPPVRRRATASAVAQDPNAHRPMAAQIPKEDPTLWKEIWKVLLSIFNYIRNLIRAIFGMSPLKEEDGQEQVVAPETAASFVGQQEKGEVLGEKGEVLGEKGEVLGEKGEVLGGKVGGADQRAFGSDGASAPVSEGVPAGASATFAAEPTEDASPPPRPSYGMAGDDPQRLFAAMTESLAQCVQACQEQQPLEADADARAYLQAMSSRLQGAIAGLRTQQAFQLGLVMSRADSAFEPGSGVEPELAERWLASGEVTPERARALREISMAQMLGVLSQMARLGMKEQTLEADGAQQDAALAEEIRHMLHESSRTLVQASVFARAAGEDPANLVREVRMRLEQQLQQDADRSRQRAHEQAGQRHGHQQAADFVDDVSGREDEGWSRQFRPA